METKMGKYLKTYEVSSSLSDRVLMRVRQAEKRQALLESVFSYSFLVLAILAVFGSGLWIYQDASQTGLWTMLSLVFTDGATILSFWKEFTVSVIESVPFISSSAVLVSLILIVLSVKNLLVVRDSSFKFNIIN
ncbi:MAG: hypothetical protein WCF94_00730 [bacterium]